MYPEGLNRGLEPVLTSLTESLAQGIIVLGTPTCKPSFLPVDLSWVTLGDHVPEASAPHRTSKPSSPFHLAMEYPPKTDNHISMTAEVQDLLPCAILDTSTQESGDSTPKRPTSMALEARMEDSSKQVATSPQASPQVALPEDTKSIGHSSPTTPVLEASRAASISAILPSKTSTGDDMGALPKEILHLQGEMNRIMRWLLTTRASMDTHWRKEVSDFQMALHQNESQTTEIIRKTEAVHATASKEVKTHCANFIQDAEAICARTIREAETTSTEHPHTLQDTHRDSMEGLERETIEEEEQNHQSFLTICRVALQIYPQEPKGVLMYPLQLLMENMFLATLLTTAPQACITREEPTPVISHPATPVAHVPSSGTKQWCHSPNPVACSPQQDEVAETSKELPCQKQKDVMPLKKLLKGGQLEAFARDSNPVQQAMEAYFRMNQPEFNHEYLCDLASLFWEMIASIGLLDLEIYEIQEVWTGWEDLQYANNALKLSLKGLWFFCPMSPSESPKVMGLKGVHHPDALCHFTGLTFCPWCGKEGQNEGTVVNHL